jgi:hypothetical protein
MLPKHKIIEAKVEPELHEEIKRYCLLVANISMKKFARIAVEYYCEELKKKGEMNV